MDITWVAAEIRSDIQQTDKQTQVAGMFSLSGCVCSSEDQLLLLCKISCRFTKAREPLLSTSCVSFVFPLLGKLSFPKFTLLQRIKTFDVPPEHK
jgi:hypothetical protein